MLLRDGVGEAVGVGVAFKAVVGGEAHAAKDKRTAGDEAVDIVAVADAEVGHRRGVTTKYTKHTKKIRERRR
jgi:hypothetical protein